MSKATGKIDVHSHFLPPAYRQQCQETGNEYPDGMPGVPQWSMEAHLKMANEVNITKSILSISSPGVHLVPGNDEQARSLCRDCNTYAADLKKCRPREFGFWATLPLPDIAASLQEVAYAFDELDADGVAVETNHHGRYLGHPDFEPVWAELDARKAIVFVHPTTGCILDASQGSVPGYHKAVPLPQYPRPIFEFFFDTARAIINLFYSGAIARYPNITYIISHAGGCLPPLIERFGLFGTMIPGVPVDKSVTTGFVKERLRKQFYFDTAGTPWPDQMYGLMRFISVKQLLYGSDYPFTPISAVKMLADSMELHIDDLFRAETEKSLVYRGNAERLLTGRGSGSGL